MNELIRKKIKADADKTLYSLKDFGNTSSASIPLTMVLHLQKAFQQKLQLLLSGFGVGLSWGSALVETKQVVCPALVELEGTVDDG